MKKQPLTIDEHATNLRHAARIVASTLEDEEREVMERLQGVTLAQQTARRLLRDTDTSEERQARLELYSEGVAAGHIVYFQRGE